MKQKPQIKLGTVSRAEAKSQAAIAAEKARQRNQGKVSVRINHRTEIMVFPDEVEYIKEKYNL